MSEPRKNSHLLPDARPGYNKNSEKTLSRELGNPNKRNPDNLYLKYPKEAETHIDSIVKEFNKIIEEYGNNPSDKDALLQEIASRCGVSLASSSSFQTPTQTESISTADENNSSRASNSLSGKFAPEVTAALRQIEAEKKRAYRSRLSPEQIEYNRKKAAEGMREKRSRAKQQPK